MPHTPRSKQVFTFSGPWFKHCMPTKACIEAIRLVAKTEGIFLDPVYTGKAMAALIDLIHKGMFSSKDTIIFIHTGGVPALFAYNREVIA